MIGNHPVGADFVVGARFVIGKSYHDTLNCRPAIRPQLVLEVASVAGSTVTCRDNLGDMHIFQAVWNIPPKIGGDRQIVWFGSIPHGEPEEILALAAVLLAKTRRYRLGRPLLLHVGDLRDDGGADANLIMPRKAERLGWHGHEDATGSEFGEAFVPTATISLPKDMLDGIAAPCLIAVDRFEAGTSFEEPSLVSGSVVRIAGLPDLEAVGAWMPDEAGRPGYLSNGNPIGIGTLEEIEYETSRGIARAELDEILVAAVPRPGSSESDAMSLSVTGIKLHDLDDVNDWLPSFSLDEGLWLGSQIGWFDAGEDGSEWDATWSRATAEDLARHGYSIDDVVSEIEGVLEVDVEPGTVAGWLDPIPEPEGVQ